MLEMPEFRLLPARILGPQFGGAIRGHPLQFGDTH